VKPLVNILPLVIIAAVFLLAWLILPSPDTVESTCPQSAQKNGSDKDSNQNAGGDNLFNEGFFRINTTLR